MRVATLLALAMVLAGCSGGGAQEPTGACLTAAAGLSPMTEPCIEVLPTEGILLGVVIDEAIRPVADAQVSIVLPDGGLVNRTTDDTGRFIFTRLEPGNYLVRVTHLLYKETQTSADVVAGDQDPGVVRVLLERLFSQEPYTEPLKFEGFIQCGYSISGVMSSLCVNDYTHFVPVVGFYTCPECEHLLDRRSADFEIGNGWQTAVFEMTWDPSTQGTSDNMRLVISHFPRPATHWYCGGVGTSPLLVRMELNVTCEDQQDEPEQVPPEGLPNMHMFAATAANGAPASAAVSQQFVVYTHVFYYGKPPEGWSFVGGDKPPF